MNILPNLPKRTAFEKLSFTAPNGQEIEIINSQARIAELSSWLALNYTLNYTIDYCPPDTGNIWIKDFV